MTELETACREWATRNDVYRLLDCGRGNLVDLLSAFVREREEMAREAERDKSKLYIAWCPECNDSMDCTNFEESCKVGGPPREYYCIGCDKTYRLLGLEEGI